MTDISLSDPKKARKYWKNVFYTQGKHVKKKHLDKAFLKTEGETKKFRDIKKIKGLCHVQEILNTK